MNKTLKIVLIVVGVLIVLVLVAPFLIPVNQFRPTIEEKASAALGRKVDVGNLSLSLISGSLAADNLSIADDPKFSKSPFLTAKSIKVGVELLPLILHKELDRKSTRLNSSHANISYAVFCLKKKKKKALTEMSRRGKPAAIPENVVRLDWTSVAIKENSVAHL